MTFSLVAHGKMLNRIKHKWI